MDTLLIILHVLVCFILIGIILLQHGKGADIGASFGGSSQSLFGSEGPVPLLNKVTTGVAVIFMITSVSLAYISANKSTGSVMEALTEQPSAETQQLQSSEVEIAAPETEEKGGATEMPEEKQHNQQ